VTLTCICGKQFTSKIPFIEHTVNCSIGKEQARLARQLKDSKPESPTDLDENEAIIKDRAWKYGAEDACFQVMADFLSSLVKGKIAKEVSDRERMQAVNQKQTITAQEIAEGLKFWPWEAAEVMVLFKMARKVAGNDPGRDTYVDETNYAELSQRCKYDEWEKQSES